MELLLALRSDGTLAWSMKHASDGDRDAALRLAWERETLAPVLIYCLEQIGGDAGERAFHTVYSAYDEKRCACLSGTGVDCPTCCNAIRAAVACPSYAELSP